MTADIVFGRNPEHNNAFSFVKVYIFMRFGLAFTLKPSNKQRGRSDWSDFDNSTPEKP